VNIGKRAKVFVFNQPVDMRKSYDGLYGLAKQAGNPLSGDVFLFVSKDRTRTKALFWDGNGLNLWMKRLERGQFADIFSRTEMTPSELQLFFEGSPSVSRQLSRDELNQRFSA